MRVTEAPRPLSLSRCRPCGVNRWSHCSCHNVSSVECCDAHRYRDAVHFRLDSQQHQLCICSPADEPSFVVWTDLILDVPRKDHVHVGRRSLHVL